MDGKMNEKCESKNRKNEDSKILKLRDHDQRSKHIEDSDHIMEIKI